MSQLHETTGTFYVLYREDKSISKGHYFLFTLDGRETSHAESAFRFPYEDEARNKALAIGRGYRVASMDITHRWEET